VQLLSGCAIDGAAVGRDADKSTKSQAPRLRQKHYGGQASSREAPTGKRRIAKRERRKNDPMSKEPPETIVFIPTGGLVGRPLLWSAGLCRRIAWGEANHGSGNQESVLKRCGGSVQFALVRLVRFSSGVPPPPLRYASLRLFTLRHRGLRSGTKRRAGRIAVASQLWDEIRLRSVYSVSVRFRFGFRKCGFTRENGKKFGLVGFYRFLLGRRKANADIKLDGWKKECGAPPRRRYAQKPSQTTSYEHLRLIDRSYDFP
jgi:hypothetical protein